MEGLTCFRIGNQNHFGREIATAATRREGLPKWVADGSPYGMKGLIGEYTGHDGEDTPSAPAYALL